jgi:hypothetical protein
VLLVPPIDTDKEIPDEQIHPLPELLRGIFPVMGGICFMGVNSPNTEGVGLIFSVDPELLFKKIDSLLQGASHD